MRFFAVSPHDVLEQSHLFDGTEQTLLQIHQARRDRFRARHFGLFSDAPTGRHNAITDVRGIRIGQVTVVKQENDQKNTQENAQENAQENQRANRVQCGVTAILPCGGDEYYGRLAAGSFILNGAGELVGMTQVNEWGLLESPIVLVDTLSVGRAYDATVDWMLQRYANIGISDDVVIPLIGECDNAWLNDVRQRPLQYAHVISALQAACHDGGDGAVAEGSVGAGTGMTTFDYAGGIGTSSRLVTYMGHTYTVGALVLSNFGSHDEPRLLGKALGSQLSEYFDAMALESRSKVPGSIIAIVATDAPLSPASASRLAKRAALGVGRVGSMAAHGSGEIMLAFSTHTRFARHTSQAEIHWPDANPSLLNLLFAAASDAVEESIWNTLCMGIHMYGNYGRQSPAFPTEILQSL